MTFPRTRGGDPIASRRIDDEQYLLPAHAGVIPPSRRCSSSLPSFPRTRGNGPVLLEIIEYTSFFFNISSDGSNNKTASCFVLPFHKSVIWLPDCSLRK